MTNLFFGQLSIFYNIYEAQGHINKHLRILWQYGVS